MSEKIYSWNAIIPAGETFPKPFLYIKPSTKFLDYAKKNDYKIIVNISGSKKYDSRFLATVTDSANYINYRPNFFNDTNYYNVILHDCYWDGYPVENGTLEYSDVVDTSATLSKPIPFTVPRPVEEFYGDSKSLNTLQLIIIGCIIMILFAFYKLR
jgi:hypothetical protein